MRPEHLTDDEFCRYADSDNPWIKSAIERIERLQSIESVDAELNKIYSLLDDAAATIHGAMTRIEDISEEK